MMLMAAFGLFIETLGRGKATKITKIYSSIFLFFSLTQFVFSPRYSDNVMQIWDYTILIYYTYVFFYDVVYFYFFDKKGPRKSNTNKGLDALIFNILIGTFAIFICGVYEILSSIFLSISFSLFVYSAFVVQIGMAFSLSQRFSGMYKRLEESNTLLEIAVQERTVELKRQTEIAVQANLAKSQFLATMSHEIRTPLNAVIGLSEIVLRRGKLFEASRNDIQQIHQSGSSLLRIINDILDISKIEANSFELIPVEYETASLINDAVTLNIVRIGSKPITFTLEINENFPQKLYGDELRVKQILNNILSNAIKYTQKGQITFSVAWEVQQNGADKKAMIHFTVRDTGIGMRREDIDKLFSDYTQLDSMANREVEGTGLGLAITKKIVEMMEGSIYVESEYGKGSVFTVSIIQGEVQTGRLPQGIGEETARKLKNFSYTAGSKEKELERSWMPYGKVLVVDDMPVNLRVASGLLEPYGLKVDTATSGFEAIEKLRLMNSNPTEKRYDLIFMDHMMPGMDGIRAVRFIRNEIGGDYCRNVPIVAFTANALVGNDEMFMSKGFNGFISKPINPVELDNVLNRFVRDTQSPEILKYAEEKKTAGKNTIAENISNEANVTSSIFEITGLDAKRGIAATGGKEAGYIEVLAIFCEDVENRLPVLQNIPDSDSLSSFVTHVHAIKSASGSIGAAKISEEAARLETAGKAGDFTLIKKNQGGFVEQLTELIKNIRAALKTNN
jgi:signal transduction histidine kinase/DNA-binding response OmpR family regulator/HPt (histidine-containing phosphotransfer) domain-containing protein